MHTPCSDPPRWTLDAFRHGACAMLPLTPGVFAFGLGFGTVAARQGFSLLDTFIMSATVFAGAAQYVVVGAWPHALTLPAIVGAGLVTSIICIRFLLIGASLRPWFGGTPAGKVYPALYLLTETNWILSMRYYKQGGRDAGFFVGSGVIVWIFWVLGCMPGYLLGAAIADPRVVGLDMVMPVFFAAMMVPMWRGARRAAAWLVAGVVAIAVDHWISGWWATLAGALAGSVTGGFDDRE